MCIWVRMVSFVFVILAITIHAATAQQILNISIGDECSTLTNSSGVCRRLNECSPAREIIDNGEVPTVCSFEGENYSMVVCCIEQPQKHVKKCKEYGSKIFKMIRTILPAVNTRYVNFSSCALVGRTLIIGGEKASTAEYPHMALIGYEYLDNQKKWNCEGSLISERFVLTSAQCLHHKTYGEASFVRLGNSERDSRHEGEIQYFNVIERIPHPDYKKSSLYNNIGLLKLDRDIIFSSLVRPICLYDKDISPKRFIASGWGGLGNENVSSDDLQHTSLDYYPIDKCNSSYSSRSLNRRLEQGLMAENQICTVAAKYEQNSCGRFSGGPLQVHHENVYCMFQLVGVRSFGNNCNGKSKPELYTKVSFYLTWIEKNIWE